MQKLRFLLIFLSNDSRLGFVYSISRNPNSYSASYLELRSLQELFLSTVSSVTNRRGEKELIFNFSN
ncbi:hypothetical protein V6N13_111152 [Hibiscus sabdariffa]|uniref:Uncharacterized protein n=1 Tax=Hibiscus sabdariffa TaxID=183260 RepID=A0ABR2TJC8_9ROSI